MNVRQIRQSTSERGNGGMNQLFDHDTKAPRPGDPATASALPCGPTTRSLSRIAQTILIITLGSLLLAPLSSAEATSTVTLRPPERASALSRATERATLILVATLLDREPRLQDGTVHTVWSARPDSIIKGSFPPDSLVQLSRFGGRVGNIVSTDGVRNPFREHGTYLLFLTRCSSLDVFHEVCEACTAELIADSAYPVNPRGAVRRDSLIDSVSVFLAACAPTYQVQRADVVVTGTFIDIDSTDFRSQYVSATYDVASVERNSRALQVPSRLDLMLPRRIRPGDPGSEPDPYLGATYLLFLQRTADDWRVLPSAYAAWRRVGSTAVVQTVAYRCGRHTTVAVADWFWLMSAIAD